MGHLQPGDVMVLWVREKEVQLHVCWVLSPFSLFFSDVGWVEQKEAHVASEAAYFCGCLGFQS